MNSARMYVCVCVCMQQVWWPLRTLGWCTRRPKGWCTPQLPHRPSRTASSSAWAKANSSYSMRVQTAVCQVFAVRLPACLPKVCASSFKHLFLFVCACVCVAVYTVSSLVRCFYLARVLQFRPICPERAAALFVVCQFSGIMLS